MKIASRVFVACIASYLTWLTTASIMARPAAPRSAPDQTETRVKTTVSKDGAAPAKPIALGKSRAIAEAHLRSSKVNIADGSATVDAHVSMLDKRPGVTYVWRLRAVNSAEQPLNGQVYDKQIFAMEANGQKEVDFHEVMAVPQGTYRIELVLYEMAPGMGMDFLNDDKAALGREMIRVVHLPTN